MNAKMFLNKSGTWIKKNWMIVAIIFGVLILTGIVRKVITSLTIFFGSMTDKSAGTDQEKVDYDFMAMTIHNDFSMKWFDWFGDNSNDSVLGLVNSLPSMNSFLELARRYALKYSEDLREKLRSKFSDNDYAKLIWK
jgi:hypothetical protein